MFLDFIPRESKILKGKSNIDFTKYNLFTYSRDAIYEISKTIKLNTNDEVIVPDYICNTLIDTLNEFTNKIITYKIDEKLSFNEMELKSLISSRTKMVFFVDYFGVETDVSVELTNLLKQKNITILKDSAHSFLTLIKNDFKSNYEYSYLVSSIYKNLNLHVGALSLGSFEQKYNFINEDIYKKRKRIYFIKKILCFLGINLINKGIENINITSEPYCIQKGNNMLTEYLDILDSIDYTQVILKKDTIAEEFYQYFVNSSLFTLEQIKRSSLQVFPLVCTSRENRDNILEIYRSKCIDVFTWPTFHKMAINDKLWSKIILLPIDKRVLEIAKETTYNV